MTEVIIDHDRLAYGLERAISRSGTVAAGFDREYCLRYAPCGLVSSAIYEYLVAQDIPAGQRISSPNLEFDTKMQHVVPVVEAPDALVIDASYSLFLGYVGMSAKYEQLTSEKIYPPEKIASFRFSEKDLFINWLTTVAAEFQAKNSHPLNSFGIEQGQGPLADAPVEKFRSIFNRIWDPAGLEPHVSTPRVKAHGLAASRFIPDDAITLG